MEATLWLEDPAIATLLADAGAVGYTLSDVQLQLEVVEMPQSLNEKLDKELFNGGAFKLPYSTWRQHINHIPSGSQNAELSINESAHNIENVMTIMTKQNRPAIVNYDSRLLRLQETTSFSSADTATAPSLRRTLLTPLSVP